MGTRLLVVDDDQKLHELLTSYLAQHDVEVVGATDGGRGLVELERGLVDVVLLDLMMPGLDGLEVLRRIRRKRPELPVIMLTARGDEADRVVGLELGADDYLPKPFSPRELLARIRAVLRRAQPAHLAERLEVNGVQVDVAARAVSVGARKVELTGLEFDLLLALMRRAGRVVPRDDLLSAAGRGDVAVGERTVDVHISHLRTKLGRADAIRTVRGVGYVFPKDGA